MISKKYRTDLTTSFRDSWDTNEYYLVISDTEKNVDVEDTLYSKNQFLEKIIFGKKIEKSEVFFVIQNIIWQGNEIFDQYDDQADMSTKRFYAVVYPSNNDTGDYRVFKCLFNNYGAPSTVPPNYDDGSVDQIYRTSDGYVWKFMFAIPDADFDKYITVGYLPIYHDSIDSNTAIDTSGSPINQVFIDNIYSNSGYEDVKIKVTDVSVGSVTFERIAGDGSLSEIKDFYTGRYFFATNVSNVSKLFEVTSYTYNENNGTGTVTLKDFTADPVIATETTASILPRIVIEGDGTGAVAIPIIDGSRIERIIVREEGSGYTNAIARVIDPSGFNPEAFNSTDERAILRPVISPRGGHNSLPVEELICTRILLYTGITLADNNTFPIEGQYTKLGLVANPQFDANTSPSVFDNRISIDLNTTANIEVNEIVTQSVNGVITFQAKVHEIANNTIYVTDYNKNFQDYSSNTEFYDVSLNPELQIENSDGDLFSINNVNLSPYIQKSGEVYYNTNFDPVQRTVDSREEYKIILEF